ncbi:MAG: hypothetical protein ACLQD9_05780 [Thermoplasmata archaeon]
MAASRPATVVDEEIHLSPGTEWHSQGLRFEGGQTIIVQAIGNDRFYGGLYTRDEYFRKRTEPNPFPFTFGTDKSQFTTKTRVEAAEYFYLVLRVGVFSRPTTIHLLVTAE